MVQFGMSDNWNFPKWAEFLLNVGPIMKHEIEVAINTLNLIQPVLEPGLKNAQNGVLNFVPWCFLNFGHTGNGVFWRNCYCVYFWNRHQTSFWLLIGKYMQSILVHVAILFEKIESYLGCNCFPEFLQNFTERQILYDSRYKMKI